MIVGVADVGAVGGEGDVAATFVEELVECRAQWLHGGPDGPRRKGGWTCALIRSMLRAEAVVLRRGRARPRRLEGERTSEHQLFLLGQVPCGVGA